MDMPNWMWLVVLVICLVVEGITISLTTIWFAVGALAAFLLGLAGVHVGVQLAVFVVISVVLLFFTRPIAVKYLKVGRTRTNAESLVGREGVTLKAMTEYQTGQVKVGGQIWSALPADGVAIQENTVVRVTAIEGVKLMVLPQTTSPAS